MLETHKFIQSNLLRRKRPCNCDTMVPSGAMDNATNEDMSQSPTGPKTKTPVDLVALRLFEVHLTSPQKKRKVRGGADYKPKCNGSSTKIHDSSPGTPAISCSVSLWHTSTSLLLKTTYGRPVIPIKSKRTTMNLVSTRNIVEVISYS